MALRLTSQQQIEVAVNGPNNANRLYICTGLAEGIGLKGRKGGNWVDDNISFEIGPSLQAGQFHRATASLAPADIYNQNHAMNAGWRIESVDADWDDETGMVTVRADIGVRDSDGYLEGISYTVFILAEVGGNQRIVR